MAIKSALHCVDRKSKRGEREGGRLLCDFNWDPRERGNNERRGLADRTK